MPRSWLTSVVSALGLALALGPAMAVPRPSKSGAARTQTGNASLYSPASSGAKTASGARFDPDKMTAASKTLPLGAKARVTNTGTGKSVKVTITDRGPFVKGRILDVSPKAAKRLGMTHDGVAPVKVKAVAAPGR